MAKLWEARSQHLGLPLSFTKYYVEDGQVDPELVSISSEHMFFKDIPSKVKDKYVYLKNSDYNNLIDYYFFSDQCMLAYLENLDNKYDNFFKF